MRYVHHIAAAAMIIYGACVLAGCTLSASAPTPTEAFYAASATLNEAEIIATIYVQSAGADPEIKAAIKAYDQTAYSAIHPLMEQVQAGQSVLTAAEADAAQAAVSALSTYLTAQRIH